MNWKQIGWAAATFAMFLTVLFVAHVLTGGFGVADPLITSWYFWRLTALALVLTALVGIAPFIREWGIGSEEEA